MLTSVAAVKQDSTKVGSYVDIAYAGFFDTKASAEAFGEAFLKLHGICDHSVDWKYVSNVGTKWEGTGYAVEGGTCSECGHYVTRPAVVAFYFDTVATSNSEG